MISLDNKPAPQLLDAEKAGSSANSDKRKSHDENSSLASKSSALDIEESVTTVQRVPDDDPNLQIPSLYQPSRAEAFSDLFLGHFLGAFFKPYSRRGSPHAEYWKIALPAFLSKPNATTIACAIRAAIMAHYGKRSGDESIQVEALGWYAKGLQSQRLESKGFDLQLAKGSSAADVFNESIICTPIMFAFFESVMCTTYPAWAQHLKAAGKMMEMLGPWRCRQGMLHQLFKTSRTGAVRLSDLWTVVFYRR